MSVFRSRHHGAIYVRTLVSIWASSAFGHSSGNWAPKFTIFVFLSKIHGTRVLKFSTGYLKVFFFPKKRRRKKYNDRYLPTAVSTGAYLGTSTIIVRRDVRLMAGYIYYINSLVILRSNRVWLESEARFGMMMMMVVLPGIVSLRDNIAILVVDLTSSRVSYVV